LSAIVFDRDGPTTLTSAQTPRTWSSTTWRRQPSPSASTGGHHRRREPERPCIKHRVQPMHR